MKFKNFIETDEFQDIPGYRYAPWNEIEDGTTIYHRGKNGMRPMSKVIDAKNRIIAYGIGGRTHHYTKGCWIKVNPLKIYNPEEQDV